MVSKITTPPSQVDLVDKVNEIIDDKQDTLVSGTNIKTINNTSLLGSGNLSVGTVTSVNNVSPVNGNVTISIPTVDQTYSASSTNAQSGVALSNAKFLQNTAGNSTSLTVFGNPSNSGTGNAINIGYSSTALNSGDIAMGRGSNARGGVSIALGFDATVTNNCSNAIQLGTGTNSTANTFNVGFRNVNNYQLLDGTTGLIPDARLSSNIARTSAIPTVNNATLTLTQGGTTKGTFTANASSNVTIDLDAGGSSYTAGTGINITNNVISVDGVQTSELSIDTTPTQNSSNLITSGGVYSVLGDVETLINAL